METSGPAKQEGLSTRALLDALSGRKMYQTWDPSTKRYGIGFFTGNSPNSLLFEHWLSPKFGYEAIVGFQKSAGSASSTSTTNTNVTGTSQTITENHVGQRSPGVLLVGGAANYALFQNEWIRIRTGFHAHLKYQMATDYAVGSSTKTVANTASPNDYTVTETSLGNTKVDSSFGYSLGPAIGSDVFLRWFPNLSIGFYGLLLWNGEQNVKSTTETRTRSYQVVAGVPQAPTSDSTSSSTTTSNPGSSANTLALGGSTFNLFGNFTIRYIW